MMNNVIAEPKDRILSIANPRSAFPQTNAGHKPFRFMHHINCVTHMPVPTSRAKALRLTASTAETMRFNFTARGFKVRVCFVEN